MKVKISPHTERRDRSEMQGERSFFIVIHTSKANRSRFGGIEKKSSGRMECLR
jgi:hypothetical protein